MSTNNRVGVRAARALLSLVEENSAEELEAAESILGSEKELTNILQLLRKYKAHDEEPLTVERLREIVRQEILSLELTNKDMISVADTFLGTKGMRMPARLSPESILDQILSRTEALSTSPSEFSDGLIELLIISTDHAEPGHANKAGALLRDLAIQSLTENRVLFPTLHALAQLRIRWAGDPLPYKHQESRQSLVKRLLKDIEQLPQEARPMHLVRELIREGLRGPADAEIAALHRMRPKKAHGE